MGFFKLTREKQKSSRMQVRERFQRAHKLPKVPRDPYELPYEFLCPQPEPEPHPGGADKPEPPRMSVASNEKLRFSFVTTEQKLTRIMILCSNLDTQRSDVIRASLELALPVFENHPEMFNYFAHLARDDW